MDTRWGKAWRGVAIALVSALALTACNGVSQVSSSAEVTITGFARHQDGSPAPDARVAMAKEIGPAEAFEGLFTVMSFGTACLVPEPPDICRERGAIAEVDGDGRYVLRVSGRDTQSFFGFASTLAVTGALPGGERAGPTTTLRFAAQSEQVELPEMRFWQTVPEVQRDGGSLRVRWVPLPSDFAPPSALTVQVETRTGLPVWRQAAHGDSVTLDPRLLEDLAYGLVLQADGKQSATNLTADVAYRTGQAAVQGAGAPPSRGATCTVTMMGRTRTVSPCPLTDGDVTTSLQPPPPEPGQAPPPPPVPGDDRPSDEVVIVNLGAAQQRSLLVLRGMSPDFTVELSADGVAWTAPISVQSDSGFAAVPLAASAAFVRLRDPYGSIMQLTEVSVW